MKDKSFLSQEFLEGWERIEQPGIIHTEDTCLLANEPFVSLFGYVRPEDVEGRPMGEFFSPWPSKSPKLGIRNIMGRRRNGTYMDVEVTCLPFLAGSRVLYQSLIRDVTELRSWEGRLLQSERLTAMGRVAGEIAHEINNPLGGILLYANLIKEDIPEDSSVRPNLEKIIKLATRCRIIAKGLLSFGSPSSRTFAPVDLNQTIKEMFSMVEDHRILRDVKVKMDLASDLPHLMGDKGQIEQVVLNLIINAGEAMHGIGELSIETQYLKERKMVQLRVIDSGPGIPEEIQSRIFEPFFTTKRHGRGTGLGLSITLGIVQRHGGKISVESVPGKGACFEVFLPVSGSG